MPASCSPENGQVEQESCLHKSGHRFAATLQHPQYPSLLLVASRLLQYNACGEYAAACSPRQDRPAAHLSIVRFGEGG